MKGAWALWDDFFFARTDARPLAVFRIAFGAYLLVYFQQLRWLLEMFLLKDGYSSYLTTKPFGGFPHDLFLGLRRMPESAFNLVYGLTFVVVLLFAVGLATRVMSVLLWLATCAWLGPVAYGGNSADWLVRILTFLFMVAGLAGHTGKCLSLDARFGRAKPEEGDGKIPIWSTRLFQLQLVAIYFFSAFHKLSVEDWYNGSALHYVLYQTSWSRWDLTWAVDYPFLTGLLTYSTVFFELVAFPVLVWNRHTRIPVLGCGVLFHLGIALLIKVFVFGELMILFYLCFLKWEHYEAVAGVCRRWFAKTPGQNATQTARR